MVSRALVLGGGGVTGVAWELGILHGMQQAGVNLGAADLVVGTSAGSIAGSQLDAPGGLEAAVATQLASPGESGETPAEVDMDRLLNAYAAAMAGSPGPDELRARIGTLALSTPTGPEQERIDLIRARLRVRDWPERRLLVTGVDVATGEFVTWDRDSGVPLVTAVAASCAVPGLWPPVTIDGRRYMDGGVRTVTNLDLAAGHDVIVVVAPIAGPSLGSGGAEEEARPLRDRSQVIVIAPDAAGMEAIGPNPFDYTRRAAVTRAGQEQGRAMAAEVRKAWAG